MDGSCILVARQEDLEAFNRLVLVHQDWVYNFAYRILGDPQDASDATQEAFVRAFRNLSAYRGGSFRAWILRIATNVCRDELRRRKHHTTIPLVPYGPSGEEIESPYWIADQSDSPEEMALYGELRETLQSCLDQLPITYRTIVVLVDILGLEYPEAAEIIGRPVGTVKSRLARARVRLRDMLLTLSGQEP